VDDQVDPFSQNVELGIGNQYRDFDQDILIQVQTGHFAIDPDQVWRITTHGMNPRAPSAREAISLSVHLLDTFTPLFAPRKGK
jgi:hypothetical protein